MLAPFSFMGGGIDPQALEHYNRVIDDLGMVPAGLLGTNAWFLAVKAVYGVTDITTAISAAYDPHYLGVKVGAGSGTTLGQAATKLYSCSGASGDLVQATAASMPLLLVKNSTDANYYFPDVSSVGCATPNAAVNQITGDIDIQFKINKKAGKNYSFSKWSGTAASASYWMYYDNGTQKVVLGYSNGSSNIEHPSSVTYTTTGILWLRATRVSSTGVVAFYFKINDSDSWTQIGANVAGASGSINVGNTTLNVANTSGFASSQEAFYRATISNTIGGTPVVDFNPASYNAATSQTQWVSSTSETWTINQVTATSGYKGWLVDRTYIMGDGVDDFLTPAAGNTPAVPTTMYCAFRGWKDNGGLARGVFGSQDANYFIGRFNYSNIATYAGGNTYLNVATSTDAIKLATYVRRNGTNELQVNNAAATSVTENTNTNTGSKVNIFFINAGYDMAVFSTGIITSSADTTTQKTAMYNLIRGMNNNAF